MTTIEDRVRGFIEVWQMRKEGTLPGVDLGVECSICGSKIIGDSTVQYIKTGLVCEKCVDGIRER